MNRENGKNESLYVTDKQRTNLKNEIGIND